MHFSLVKISPPGIAPAHGFDDAILPVFFALRRLGYAVEILYNRTNSRSRNIVFGSCLAPRKTGRDLPPGSIIFNLEQLTGDSKWANHDYFTHLRDFPVWDYSQANIAALARHGIHTVQHVPPGYVPEMTRIRQDIAQDVDVLFYGLINDRRHAVIKGLYDAGIKILATQEAFGDVRDALLARSRLLLNIHYYVPARLEIVRLGYAFANRKAVVAELRGDTEIPAGLEGACAFFPYDALLDGVRELLADADMRKRQEQAAFTAFAAMPLTATLEKLLGRRSVPSRLAAPDDSGPAAHEAGEAGRQAVHDSLRACSEGASVPGTGAHNATPALQWQISEDMCGE